jgi:hypothetical protein
MYTLFPLRALLSLRSDLVSEKVEANSMGYTLESEESAQSDKGNFSSPIVKTSLGAMPIACACPARYQIGNIWIGCWRFEFESLESPKEDPYTSQAKAWNFLLRMIMIINQFVV